MKRLLLLALPLYALDQITKHLVLWYVPLHDSWEMVPGLLNLVHYTNTGAAFGAFSDNNSFFIGLSVVTLIALAFFRSQFADRWSRIGLGLLVSGILGNLTDRLLHKHVIDFIDVHWHGNHWPAFNVADSCICIAAGLFIIGSFLEKKRA